MSAAETGHDSTFQPLINDELIAKYEIHSCCRDGRTARVEMLLKENPKLVKRVDDDGRLPIHWAVAHNHPEIVHLLMDQPGFDVDIQDELGWTPLMIACSRKDGDELVELFLERGADVNMTDNLKRTALHFAVSKDRVRVVDMLLKKNASVTMPDNMNRYPIHRAAAAGSIRMLRSLLQKAGQLNRSDSDGMTALHYAIAEGHVDAAFLLIEDGADTSKTNRAGRLPIEMNEDMNVIRMIRDRAKADGIEITLPGDGQ